MKHNISATFHLLILMLPILTFALTSCSEHETFSGGENEEKPEVLTNPIYFGGNSKSLIKTFHGFYEFTITNKKSGEIMCRGDAEIVNYVDRTMNYGQAKCDSFVLNVLNKEIIDFGSKEAQLTEKVPIEELQAGGFDTRVVRIRSEGKTKYFPHKADIIGPIIQDPLKFQDIDFEEPVRAVYDPQVPGEDIQEGSGSVRVKVMEINATYRPTPNFETFNRVIHYSINSTGFDGLKDKSKSSIYPVYEYRWNTQPMVLLNVHIEGKLQDFGQRAAGNAIFGGGLVIDLKLKELVQVEEL